ncbi:MAG: PKD domain-containing protein [bacterium]
MQKLIYIIIFIIALTQLNGKNGWYPLNSGTDKFLYDVCFVDSLNGWVVGNDGLILRTTDGGINWEEQDANVGSWLLSISFLDKFNGWVAGDNGRIRKTTDAGGRWIIQDTDFDLDLNSIYFVNTNKGWATCPLGIIHTEDGGEHWYFQDSANFSVSKSIFFVNENAGWACGANGTIVRTFDGGNTWQKLEPGNTGIFYDIFFLDLSNGWAVSRHEPKILRTTNGGNDWTPQNHPIDGFFKTIQFIDKNNGWAAGPGGIISTTDGGKNWKVQIPDSRYNIWSMQFINKNKGWAVVGDGTILKTDNGGIKFVVDFKASVQTGDAPLSTTFTDLSEGNPDKWFWDFGDGGTHTTQNPVYIYQKPGVYNVSLTVSDALDNDSKTKYNYIVVTGANELKADFTADTTEGDAPLLVQFTDLSTGNPEKWSWDFGNGATHKSQNPIQVYQNSGTFTVSLTVERGQDKSTETKVNYIIVKDPISVMDRFNVLNINDPMPNPASDFTQIDFELESDAFLSIKIFDIFGKEIICLFDGLSSSGKHNLKWNMKSTDGTIIPEGIYLCRFSLHKNNSSNDEYKKIIYLKH